MTDDDLLTSVIPAWNSALGQNVDARPGTDFFASGGDSLAALRLVTQLEQEHEVELDMRVIASSPSPAGITAAVRTAKKAERATV